MSKATLKDIATSMILTCSKSHSQPPENPQHWLLNWSKQQLEKVTFVLDNADDVLESDYKEDRLIRSLEKEPLDVLQDDEISVEKAIKTSFDLLSQTEQEALAIMSVFPGSFDSDAAEAVIAAGIDTEAQPIVRILRSLKNRSLLEQPSSCRYQIHQLIQAFAKKMGQTEASRQVLLQGEIVACSHFISRLANNANMYWSKDKCKESIEAFNEDRHNFEYFLQVYVHVMEKRNVDFLQTSTRRFLDDFPQKCMYLEMCLLPSFYILILEGLLKNFDRESQPVHTVELLCLLGHEKRKVGNQTQYKDLMKQAKLVYAGNYTEFRTNGLSRVYFFNSYASFLSGRMLSRKSELVIEVYEIALKLCRRTLNEHPETAATLLFIGRHQKNIAHLQEAMDLFRHCLGEHFMTALGHKAIADLYFVHGSTTGLDKSLEHYGEALAMMEKLGVGDHKESILTLKNYGLCHRRKGNYQEAINFLAKANLVAEIELEDVHKWKVMIETQLALLYLNVGRVEEAKLFMKKGLEMCHRLGQSIDHLRLANRADIKTFINLYPEITEDVHVFL
ncbi:hypothetical protein OS493_027532 [Desmophyllum pertusum]|uniref:Uncharacterized protein n=1 Tax=Desmophyllum pertusum TaxID=174260 RepID=A0A9X0CDL8_9CNID|nr:hypothetical protein OS493_027532 [Desmophyllum pertusum]